MEYHAVARHSTRRLPIGVDGRRSPTSKAQVLNLPRESIQGASRFLRAALITVSMVLIIAFLVNAGGVMHLVSFVFLFGLVQLALGMFAGRLLRGHSCELSEAELDTNLESYASATSRRRSDPKTSDPKTSDPKTV